MLLRVCIVSVCLQALDAKFGEKGLRIWYRAAPQLPLLRMSDPSHLDFMKQTSPGRLVVWCTLDDKAPA
eukprot:m.63094 g.63094  ORF g.63094 m.63094 type:complete len:69 (+) comp13421_c0_seq1:97-303(+)